MFLWGVTYTHATGGGTGGGLTMKVEEILQPYLGKIAGSAFNFSIFPSRRSNYW